jgi:hypothetical protein
MLVGLPDLARPLPGFAGDVYAAFGRNGMHVVLPQRLVLLASADGSPELRLSLLRSVDATGVHSSGRLEIAVSLESDLERIAALLADTKTPGALTIAELERGVFWLEALLGPLAPAALAQARALSAAELGRVRVVSELGSEAASIAERVLTEGSLPLFARLSVGFLAVPPRLPLAVTLDLRRAAEQLEARLGADARAGAGELESAFWTLLEGPALVVEGDLQSVEPGLLRQTLALRLRSRFTAELPDDLERRALLPPAEVAAGRERIDLSEPAAVQVSRALTLDPLASAHAMHQGPLSELVRRIETPALSIGRQRLSVTANLPEPVAGLLALFADFRAPAAPPFRPFGIAQSVSLTAPERLGETVLKLAPGEPVSGEARLRALLASGDEVTELSGPWRAAQGGDVLLGASDLGVPLLLLRASRALLRVADVEVSVQGRVLARLDAERPLMSVPSFDATLRVLVRPTSMGREIEVDVTGRTRLDLDLATLPGFGVHHARLIAVDGLPACRVEWRPEGDDAAELLSTRLGGDCPVAEIRWLASSPFRPGVVWRTQQGGASLPWSAPLLPAEGLEIRVGAATP